MLRSCAYVRGPGCSSRWRPRLGPRLERTQALCGPCVSRTGLSPSACGRRTRAELHIQDIRPRMHPSSAAPRRGASRTHPCCSFPCSALRAHGTLQCPGRGEHLRVLCRTSLRCEIGRSCRILMPKKPTGPEATMIVDRYDPINLFELVPKLKLQFEPELAQLDELLDDDELFNLLKADLLKRYPHSGRLGRHSTPVE